MEKGDNWEVQLFRLRGLRSSLTEKGRKRQERVWRGEVTGLDWESGKIECSSEGHIEGGG